MVANKPGSRGREIYVLAGLQLSSWGTSFYTFGLTLIPIENELGISRSAAALAFPVALLFEGICSVVVGKWIARRLGAHVMACGSLLCGAGLLVLSQAGSLLHFHIAWALIGSSFACTLYTPLFSLLAVERPTTYRREVTLISLITGFSSTLFVALSGWLMAEVGWRHCVLLYAALNAFCCAPGHWFALTAFRQKAISTDGALASDPAWTSSQPAPSQPGQRKLWIYVCLAVFTSAIGAISAAVAAYLVPILMTRGVASEVALAAPAAIGALQTLARLPMLMRSADAKVHQLNLILIALFPVALVLLQTAGTNRALLLAFVVVYGIAHGGWTVVRATSVPQYLGTQATAVSNGTIAFWATVGRIALPAFIAFSWAPGEGSGSGGWLLLAVAMVGCMSYALAQRIYFRGLRARGQVD